MVSGGARLARALAHQLRRPRPTAPQGLRLALAACLALCAGGALAATPSIEGTWQGSFEGLSLRIVVHLSRTPQGEFAATMDSPDQGAFGLAVDTLSLAGDTLRFRMKSILADYVGAVSADRSRIVGRWRQGATTLPLTLARSTATLERPARPQEPKPPFPYRQDTVRVVNRAASVSLAGTWTRPAGRGPFPAVVLITGSGPEDRDETVFGHRPFLVLADHLARHGIAALRLDDRGVGASSGRFSGATTEDFAADAEAAVEFLASRSEVDPRGIGLIGHSEGGLVAPMVAARSPRVAFIVLLAAPGVPGDSILVEQVERVARAAGADEATALAERRLERAILRVVRESRDSTTTVTRVGRLFRERIAELPPGARERVGNPDTLAAAAVAQLRSPWLSFFIAYDPRPALGRVRCPVLALDGGKDVQVDARTNLEAIAQALRAAGNRDFETKELPGLNHLFQTAKTGAVGEYAGIEETFAPEALETIHRWISSHVPARR